MTPTTTAAIKELVRAAILAITPRHAAFRECAWKHIPPPWSGIGGESRGFFVRSTIGVPLQPGFFSNGESYVFEVQVVVSYGFIRGEAMPDLLTDDHADIYNAIDDLREGADPTGVYDVRDLGVAAEELAEDGSPMRVVHRYRIEYLYDTRRP